MGKKAASNQHLQLFLVYTSNYTAWGYEDRMQWWYQHLGRQILEGCWKGSRRWTYRGSWGSEKANAVGLDSKKWGLSGRDFLLWDDPECVDGTPWACVRTSTREWLQGHRRSPGNLFQYSPIGTWFKIALVALAHREIKFSKSSMRLPPLE